MKRALLSTILRALPLVIRRAANRHRSVRDQLERGDCVLQLRLRDNSIARHYIFKGGKVTGRAGLHSAPDAEMVFGSVRSALAMVSPKPDYGVIIDALKNFKVTAGGSDRWIVWFGQLMHLVGSAGWKYGVRLKDGSVRYTNLTNGGPLHVTVRDGRIVRTTPIDFDDDDAPPWSIHGTRPDLHAAPHGNREPARARDEVAGVFAEAAAVSDEARRLRSRRRA